MEDLRTSIERYLSPFWDPSAQAGLREQWADVQEIRVRAGVPLCCSSVQGDVYVGGAVGALQVQELFLRLCDHAVHTHQDELRQGFITTKDGVRVGVAGTAVLSDGAVRSYRDITSLCIRVPRNVDGCADSLLPYMEHDRQLCGLLLCGPPASGKTTILRDAARSLSSRHRIAVVDERRELAMSSLARCDVLIGCPKAHGILQVVRTLAPDAVIVDEIGDAAEWQAVAQSVYCGVAVIASVHASCERELTAREEIVSVLRNGGFAYTAFLPPRTRPFEKTIVRKAAELFENGGGDVDRVGVCRDRFGGSSAVSGM